jgi:hypothetical protein
VGHRAVREEIDVWLTVNLKEGPVPGEEATDV